MTVTGLIITNDKTVSIGRKKKREIRSLVHKWDVLTLEKKKYLQGYLSFCAGIEPLFINSLCEKFSARKIRDIQKQKL
jgi:RNA-directed DNA polymerase